ncbi:outer membrane protein P1 [Neisseria meningitidis]|nr:outer membrane protein P1 [Neisseria meningitidis]
MEQDSKELYIILVYAVFGQYSGLNLNQYSVASPCRTICTVCGFIALSDLNLIHYKYGFELVGKQQKRKHRPFFWAVSESVIIYADPSG